MSSHFPAKLAPAIVVALLALAACNKSPATDTATTATQTIKPGFVPARADGLAAGQVDPRVLPYLNSKQVVMDGKALYQAHNCNGCHSNGGGGMGPALMDDEWIYGGRIEGRSPPTYGRCRCRRRWRRAETTRRRKTRHRCRHRWRPSS